MFLMQLYSFFIIQVSRGLCVLLKSTVVTKIVLNERIRFVPRLARTCQWNESFQMRLGKTGWFACHFHVCLAAHSVLLIPVSSKTEFSPCCGSPRHCRTVLMWSVAPQVSSSSGIHPCLLVKDPRHTYRMTQQWDACSDTRKVLVTWQELPHSLEVCVHVNLSLTTACIVSPGVIIYFTCVLK